VKNINSALLLAALFPVNADTLKHYHDISLPTASHGTAETSTRWLKALQWKVAF